MSEHEDKLYIKIQILNKKDIVTMDSLFEGKDFKAIDQITESVKTLRSLGLITTSSIRNHGRFETEIIPKDGYVYHEPKRESKEVRKMKVQEEIIEDDDVMSGKEKVVIQKVRRKA